MTPLAHAIAKQATLAPNKRMPCCLEDNKTLVNPVSLVDDIHCFEVTEVFDLAVDLADEGQVSKISPDVFFLPAPRTWIEHREESGRRIAWAMSGDPFKFSFVVECKDRYVVMPFDLWKTTDEVHSTLGLVLAMLALINTPKIVTQNEFSPHRGLERLWAKNVSKVPLNAWHELKLHIAKPFEIDDGEPHQSHLTGRRALHFCRSHLRIRNGCLEYVNSHWRGDPSLGTKLHRYRVQP